MVPSHMTTKSLACPPQTKPRFTWATSTPRTCQPNVIKTRQNQAPWAQPAQNVVVVHGCCVTSWQKNQLCCNILYHGWHFTSKGPEADMAVLLFWPPITILRFLAENTLFFLSDAPNTGKRVPKTQEAQSWRATLFSRAREGDHQDQSCETILAHVQKDPDDLQRASGKDICDEMLAASKESAQGPDSLPYSVFRCVGGIGSQLLLAA